MIDKFYVASGDFCCLIAAEHPVEAAIKAIRSKKPMPERLLDFVVVSQKGFVTAESQLHEDDALISTEDVLARVVDEEKEGG